MIEYELPGAKWANVDIVGEFARKDELLKIIGGRPRGTDQVDLETRVHLVPEPDNPYSKSGKAISVRVDGVVVGYLSEVDAKKWAPELHRVVASGGIPTTVGSVYAYTKYNGDMEYNVRVALPDPGFIVPLNVGRVSQISVLPWGNALQVTKEEDHLSHLFEYVPASGLGMVILTMHQQQQTLKNGTVKELVEVRLDGERVGQMTPASSAHFLPTIRHANDMGTVLGVWAKLKGSSLSVELTVQGARATDLSDDWLREMPTMIPLVPFADHYDVPPAFQGAGGRKRSLFSSKAVPPSSRKFDEGSNFPQSSMPAEPLEVVAVDPPREVPSVSEPQASGTPAPHAADGRVQEVKARAEVERVQAEKHAQIEAKQAEAALLREQRLHAKAEAKAAAAPAKQERRAAQAKSALNAGKTTARVVLKIVAWALIVFGVLFVIAGISLWSDGDAASGIGGLIMGLIVGTIAYFILRAGKKNR